MGFLNESTASAFREKGKMMKEVIWTVARFPDGSWSSGGRPTDSDYACCEVFQVEATSREDAERKAIAKHRKTARGKAI